MNTFFQEVSIKPLVKRIITGFLLIGFVVIISFFIILSIGTLGIAVVLISDDGLYVLLICFVCATITSYIYYSLCRFSQRKLLPIYASITVLFFLFFFVQLNYVRQSQELVIESYLNYHQAVTSQNYEQAYEMMTPNYRQTHSIEDLIADNYFLGQMMASVNSVSKFNVETGSKTKTFIVIGNKATFWNRPSVGIAVFLEKINGRWYFNGDTAFYLIG